MRALKARGGVSTVDELKEAVSHALSHDGPHFIWARIEPPEPRRRRCVTMNWRTSTASFAISKRPKGSISYAYRCLRATNLNSPRISMAPSLPLSLFAQMIAG